MIRFKYLFLCLCLLIIFSINNWSYSQISFKESNNSFEGVYNKYSDRNIAFSDINNDKAPDLLITGVGFIDSNRTAFTKLYKNDGEGNFTEIKENNIDSIGHGAVDFADIDADGDEDLIIAGITNNDSAITRLYKNDGNGNFSHVYKNSDKNSPFVNVGFSSVKFADINGDDYPDVFITGLNNDLFSKKVSALYLNNGKGLFSLKEDSVLEAVTSGSIAFSDIDNDKDNDLLITGSNAQGESTTELYTNDGKGNFKELKDIPFDSLQNSSVAFADIDNDGDEDLLLTGRVFSEEYTQLFKNNGNGKFKAKPNPFLQVKKGKVAFADVDNDKDKDVFIIGNKDNATAVANLYKNDGTGNFKKVDNMPFANITSNSASFEDVNNDNKPDLMITGAHAFSVSSKLYFNKSCFEISDNVDSINVCKQYALPNSGKVYSEAGEHRITQIFSNEAGCDSIKIIHLNIMPNASVDKKKDRLKALAKNVDYQWLDCNKGYKAIAGKTDSIFVPDSTGKYALMLAKEGCRDTSACKKYVVAGISQKTNKDQFRVYPNPSSDGIYNVDLRKKYNDVKVTVINAEGKEVSKFSYINKSHFTFEIDGPQGLYFISIKTDSTISNGVPVLKR